MTDQHPITPPPALVTDWLADSLKPDADSSRHSKIGRTAEHVALHAARWGADQELEACCEWLERNYNYPQVNHPLRAARRPKQSSMNEVALQMLGTIERDAHYIPEITDTIRRALEALPNG